MQSYSISPVELFRSLYRNRGLIWALVVRDVIGRYRGSVLGILWSFFNPIFMLTVYTFVFSVVFKARWSTNTGSKTEFALVLFAGLIVFNFFAECINKGPTLITSNVNYVKKVVFPLEILPWVVIGSVMFHMLVSIGVWLVAYIIIYGIPHLTVLYLPVVLAPLVFLTIGVVWALASLGVYLRDVGQFIGIVVTTLMFVSPIFYPITALPERYRVVLLINPLTIALNQVRDVLYWGKTPDLLEFTVYLSSTLIVAWLGFAWFQKTRKGFADVI